MKLPILPLTAAVLLTLTLPNPVIAIDKGKPQNPQKTDLKPSEYVWQAEASSKGSVNIVVSLASQLLWVYRDGLLIGRSTISSGSKGRETPAGIYMILEKNLTHHSNKYHEASMPFMERLTWTGLAIHAGNTPGHPESHGCMHVPADFAKKLYGVTEEGNTVLIANTSADPSPTSDPNLLFLDPPDPTPAPAPDAAPASAWKPQEVPNGPFSIIFSSADRRVYAYRKGVQIGRAELGGADGGAPFGNHVYTALAEAAPDGSTQWALLGSLDDSPELKLPELAKALSFPTEFRQQLKTVVKPGTTLVITDRPAGAAKPVDPD